MKLRLLLLLTILFIAIVAIAATQFPDDVQFLQRVIVERRTSDRTPSTLQRGAIYYDQVNETFKGVTSTSVVTFQTGAAGTHDVLSATHSDTVNTTPSNGQLLEYTSSLWRNIGPGAGNTLLGINASGTQHEYKTLSGTANEITVTPTGVDYAFSIPDPFTLGDGTLNSLTLVTPLAKAQGGTGITATGTANQVAANTAASAFTYKTISGTLGFTASHTDSTINIVPPQDLRTTATPVFSIVTGTLGFTTIETGGGGDSISLIAPAVVPVNKTWVLPATDVVNGFWKSDGSGNITLVAASGTGACSAGQVVTGLNAAGAPTCAQVANTFLKTAVGEAVGSLTGGTGDTIEINMNDYSFAPSITNNGLGTGKCVQVASADDAGTDTVAKLSLVVDNSISGCSGTHGYDVDWRYITASRDPEVILLVEKSTGKVVGIWKSEIDGNTSPIKYRDGYEVLYLVDYPKHLVKASVNEFMDNFKTGSFKLKTAKTGSDINRLKQIALSRGRVIYDDAIFTELQ